MVDAAIEVQQLSKTVAVGFFGRPVSLLHDVTFSVARGATTGFVGKNGAGKSTTIKHVIGGASPTKGTVRVLGGDPRATVVRRRFGYMPELPYLPPTLTPAEMMWLHATLCGADATKIAALLERVDLGGHADKRVGSFSKGMQTRLTLALALLHEPELLILDEPMSGLDPVGRQLVRTMLREQASMGRTIFFSSHVLADVEALCDSVIVIDAGRIVYTGTTSSAVGDVVGAWLIRIVVGANEDAKLRALSGVRDVRREGDTLVVTVDGEDGVAAAVKLQGAGARVLSVDPLRKSLEQRVLELVEKGAA